MPFGDNNPNSVNWPVIPIQFSKQYYALMQVSYSVNKQHGVARVSGRRIRIGCHPYLSQAFR